MLSRTKIGIMDVLSRWQTCTELHAFFTRYCRGTALQKVSEDEGWGGESERGSMEERRWTQKEFGAE